MQAFRFLANGVTHYLYWMNAFDLFVVLYNAACMYYAILAHDGFQVPSGLRIQASATAPSTHRCAFAEPQLS